MFHEFKVALSSLTPYTTTLVAILYFHTHTSSYVVKKHMEYSPLIIRYAHRSRQVLIIILWNKNESSIFDFLIRSITLEPIFHFSWIHFTNLNPSISTYF
jgi:hypothetical protein